MFVTQVKVDSIRYAQIKALAYAIDSKVYEIGERNDIAVLDDVQALTMLLCQIIEQEESE